MNGRKNRTTSDGAMIPGNENAGNENVDVPIRVRLEVAVLANRMGKKLGITGPKFLENFVDESAKDWTAEIEADEQDRARAQKLTSELEAAAQQFGVTATDGKIEAREFMRVAGGFGGNRFGRIEDGEAADLIERLYGAGAVRVDVSGILAESYRIKREGGMYADTLIVTPPKNGGSKFALAIAKGRADELNENDDGTIRMWWD